MLGRGMDAHVSAELRAERLRLFIAAIGEEPSMRAFEGAEYGFVPGGWSYYMEDGDPADFPEDFDLAWECAAVAQDLRDRQWDALEQLGAAFAAGEGATGEERIASMPAEEARRALLAAYRLGWNLPAPAER